MNYIQRIIDSKIKDNSDTLKILCISEQCYSGILKYINKEEAWKAYED